MIMRYYRYNAVCAPMNLLPRPGYQHSSALEHVLSSLHWPQTRSRLCLWSSRRLRRMRKRFRSISLSRVIFALFRHVEEGGGTQYQDAGEE